MAIVSRLSALVSLVFGTALYGSSGFAQSLSIPPVTTTLTSQNSVPLSEVRKVPGEALAADGSAGASAAVSSGGYRVWSSAFGFGGRIGADGLAPSSHTSGAGLSVGIEKVVDPTLLFGFSVTGVESHMASVASSTRSRSVLGTLYGAWHRPDGLEIDGALGFGDARLTQTHLVDTGAALVQTRGSTDAPLLTGTTIIGLRRPIPGGLGAAYWKPFASLTYAGEFLDSYSESDGAGTTLLFPSRSLERLTGQLGLAIGTDISGGPLWRIHPEIRAAWADDFVRPSLTTTAYSGGTPILLRDSDPGRSGAILSADIAAWRSEALELSAGYAIELRRNSVAQLGRVGFRILW